MCKVQSRCLNLLDFSFLISKMRHDLLSCQLDYSPMIQRAEVNMFDLSSKETEFLPIFAHLIQCFLIP